MNGVFQVTTHLGLSPEIKTGDATQERKKERNLSDSRVSQECGVTSLNMPWCLAKTLHVACDRDSEKTMLFELTVFSSFQKKESFEKTVFFVKTKERKTLKTKKKERHLRLKKERRCLWKDSVFPPRFFPFCITSGRDTWDMSHGSSSHVSYINESCLIMSHVS